MAKKVKISREASEAIELMRAQGATLTEIVERHYDGELIPVNGYEHVSGLSLDTLIRALYIGYEVEETPEDKVMELYKNPDLHELNPNSYRIGIRDALNALNIKIDGVNA